MKPEEYAREVDAIVAEVREVLPRVDEISRRLQDIEYGIEDEPWAWEADDEPTPEHRGLGIDRAHTGLMAIEEAAGRGTGSTNPSPALLAEHGFEVTAPDGRWEWEARNR